MVAFKVGVLNYCTNAATVGRIAISHVAEVGVI